jgi:hypothetical protein
MSLEFSPIEASHQAINKRKRKSGSVYSVYSVGNFSVFSGCLSAAHLLRDVRCDLPSCAASAPPTAGTAYEHSLSNPIQFGFRGSSNFPARNISVERSHSLRPFRYRALMPKFRTHYDNLKVSRDAPIEVIQAAYRSLARKYHPDTNGSHPKSEAIMKAINASYEVLSDPVRRAKHDDWIAAQLTQRGSFHGSSTSAGHETPDTRSPRQRGKPTSEWSFFDMVLMIAYFGAALMLLRIPNLRLVAIGMLVAGWIFFRVRHR